MGKPNPFLIPEDSSPTPRRAQNGRNGIIEPAQFLVEVDEMLDSGKFDWAEDTLTGISETVDRTERVTQNQLAAVRKIAESRGWEIDL